MSGFEGAQREDYDEREAGIAISQCRTVHLFHAAVSCARDPSLRLGYAQLFFNTEGTEEHRARLAGLTEVSVLVE